MNISEIDQNSDENFLELEYPTNHPTDNPQITLPPDSVSPRIKK